MGLWRTSVSAIAMLLGTAAAAYGEQDPLAIFDGTWVAVNPPGPRVIFNKVGLGQRTATLPIIGAASIRVSGGKDESELKVSGSGFDPYYSFSRISAREMVWHRKSGSDVCPQSAWFKREEEEATVTVTKCDLAAASPDDDKRVSAIPWAPFAELNADKAIAACQEDRHIRGDLARIWFQLGRAYHKAAKDGLDGRGSKEKVSSHLVAAEEALNEALDRDEKYKAAYASRGEVRVLRGDNGEKQKYDAAIGDLTKAIDLGMKSATVYERLGYAHLQQGQYKEAIADLSKAIWLDRNFARAYNSRGIAFARSYRVYINGLEYEFADLKKASTLDSGLKIDPRYALAYRARGDTYYDAGVTRTGDLDGTIVDYNRAIADYTKAREIDRTIAIPNFAAAYNDRGSRYARKKDDDRAIADYTKAIEINPRYGLAYSNRAHAYFDKKWYDLAIRDYTKAIEINPRDGDAYNNRGFAREEIGDRTGAIADYRSALSVGPNDQWTRDAVRRLGALP